jgi:ribonuclease HII
VPPAPSLHWEEAAWSRHAFLLGVDEVGRGPLAGPVVVAAAVFPPHARRVRGVRDSKSLSAIRRARLVPRILASATTVCVAAASVREIDRLNIRQATALAMRRAIRRAKAALGPGAEVSVIIDGLPLPECGHEHEALVQGDARCYSIAAAGIVAKEVRDRLMRRLSGRYPGYGWEHNAGYCTEAHVLALGRLGATPHHRQSFAPVAQLTLELLTG